jgi:hypothetical protein
VPDRLTPAEETRLLEHYRSTPAGPAHRTDTVSIPRPGAGADAEQGTDTAMTRAEEQLQVSTVVEPWTRAVLRIEEVTEEVMVPVTITRQQARIEYLPLRVDDRGGDAGEAAEAGAERPTSTGGWVTLWTEQPTVTLERVPAERVRLRTEWVSEETTFSDRLRRERIELTTTETPPQ